MAGRRAFLARWLEDSARPRIKPRSYERFAELIRLHIAPVLGSGTGAVSNCTSAVNRLSER